MESVKSNPSVLDESHEGVDKDYDVVEYEEMNSDHSDMESEADKLKVMFHGSKNTYRFGESIDVRFYSFNNSHQMEDEDRVGIAPLKRSPFYSQKVRTASEDAGIDIISEDFIEETQITAKKLTFVVEDLPNEIKDERFFQFCYLNDQAQVIGLSVPFQFLKSNQSSPAPEVADEQNSSVMEIEVGQNNSDEVHCERQEDDDFIVVRTTDNFLKERVQHLTRNNNLIQNLVRNLQTELTMKIQENANLNDAFEKVESKLVEAKNELNRLNMVTGIEKENIRKTYEVSIDALKKELAENERKIAELKETIAERTEVIHALTDDLEGIKRVVPESQEKDKKIEELKQSLEAHRNDFEAYRSKRELEVKDLEETLRKSMDNLKNMNLKFENSEANSAKVERDLKMKLKNEQDRVQLLFAKLEEAKIEYSMAHNRTLYFKNKTLEMKHELNSLKKKPTPMVVSEAPLSSAIPSAPPLYTSITVMETETVRDEIDSRLDDLEKEELLAQQRQSSLQSSSSSSLNQSQSSDSKAPAENSQLQKLFELERKQREEQQKSNPAPMESEPVDRQFETIPKQPIQPIPLGFGSSSAGQAPASNEDYSVVLPCVFCNMSINCKQHNDGSGQMREMIEHLEKVHYQKMCPICSTLFDMKLAVYKSYFTNHVNEHLKNATYPTLDR